jgi:transposase
MMPIDADIPLPDDLDAAHRLIRELLATLRQQTHLNDHLQHQLEQLLRRLYGRKSEKLDPNPLVLFAQEIVEAAGPKPTPELESSLEPMPPAPAKPPIKGHGRKPLPASLPRRRVVHDVPPEKRLCPDCGLERACFGEEIREQIEYVPASIIIIEHVRPNTRARATRPTS